MLLNATVRQVLSLILIAIAVIFLVLHDQSTQTRWMILGALFVASIPTDIRIKNYCKRIIVFAVSAGVLLSLFGNIEIPILIAATGLGVLTYYAESYAQAWRDNAFLIFILLLLVIVAATNPVVWHVNLERSIYCCIGMGLAFTFRLIFLLNSSSQEIQTFKKIMFLRLRRLNDDLFTSLLREEYPDYIYLFERRIHKSKAACMQVINILRTEASWLNKRLAKDKAIFLDATICQLDMIFIAILNCGLIRQRNTDHTIFSVCNIEIKEIYEQIDLILKMLSQGKLNVDITALDDKIIRLEQSYQHVLQISAREPLVILMFIEALKSLIKEINEYSNTEVLCRN